MRHHLSIFLSAVLLCLSFTSQAQFQSPGGLPAGFQHALLDVVGRGFNFTGHMQIKVGNDTIPASIAVYAGSMRLEAQSFTPGSNMTAYEAASLKNMHTITICRPDTNRMFLVYPMFSSYVELNYSKSKGMDPLPLPQVVRTSQGKDPTVGDNCEKSVWSITEGDGQHYDATVWASTNATSFPVQLQIGNPPALVVFDRIDFVAADPNLFVPPAGYYKYEGIQDLILKEADRKRAATNAAAGVDVVPPPQ